MLRQESCVFNSWLPDLEMNDYGIDLMAIQGLVCAVLYIYCIIYIRRLAYAVHRQRSQILDYLVVVSGNPNMVMALAGNKADLEDKRKVTAEVSNITVV